MLIKRHPLFAFFSFTLLLQLVLACSAPAQTAPTLQGENWVIFPAAQAKDQSIGKWLMSNGQSVEYWTPSEEDVLALENGLGDYLQKNPDRFYEGTPVWERLDEYNRQYIGILLDGKRIIYANYFCDSADLDWRENFVFVMDGGDCFFQFKYGVESAEFFDLQVNGVAYKVSTDSL